MEVLDMYSPCGLQHIDLVLTSERREILTAVFHQRFSQARCAAGREKRGSTVMLCLDLSSFLCFPAPQRTRPPSSRARLCGLRVQSVNRTVEPRSTEPQGCWARFVAAAQNT